MKQLENNLFQQISTENSKMIQESNWMETEEEAKAKDLEVEKMEMEN